MKILALILLGAIQGKLGPTSTGSITIRITILPAKPTEQQIIAANNGEIIGNPGVRVKVIKDGDTILVEPQ